MSFKSIIENYREHGLKYFTVKRAKLVLRSFVRFFTGLRLKQKDAIVFSEVIIYKSLTCPDCVELGHCRICKCPVNELFTSMEVGCSDGKFPAFQENRSWKNIWFEIKKGRLKEALKEFKRKKGWKKSWKEYKEKNGIFLTKFYG